MPNAMVATLTDSALQQQALTCNPRMSECVVRIHFHLCVGWIQACIHACTCKITLLIVHVHAYSTRLVVGQCYDEAGWFVALGRR